MRKAVKQAHDKRKGDIDKFHVKTALSGVLSLLVLGFAAIIARLFCVVAEAVIGNGVVAAAAKGIAAGDTADRQDQTTEEASFLKRLKGVGGTGRTEPATASLER